jgi:hypothetical protein
MIRFEDLYSWITLLLCFVVVCMGVFSRVFLSVFFRVFFFFPLRFRGMQWGEAGWDGFVGKRDQVYTFYLPIC